MTETDVAITNIGSVPEFSTMYLLMIPDLEAVLRIRIHQIHMFLGLLDPDPLFLDMILLSLSKNSKENHAFYWFVTSFWLFIFEKWCKCTFKQGCWWYKRSLIKAWIEAEASASTRLFFGIHVRTSKSTRTFEFRTTRSRSRREDFSSVRDPARSLSRPIHTPPNCPPLKKS
jgi:hypothetical protein